MCATAVAPSIPIWTTATGAKPHRSFFSGHTAMSFTGAGLACSHHFYHDVLGGGTWDGVACATAMTAAATVGAMRVVGDQHYLSDVLVGATVGTISGLGVRWLLHYGPAAQHDDELMSDSDPGVRNSVGCASRGSWRGRGCSDAGAAVEPWLSFDACGCRNWLRLPQLRRPNLSMWSPRRLLRLRRRVASRQWVARYWELGRVRWFGVATVELGYAYAKPKLAVGYGRPYWSWVGIEAYPALSLHGVSPYGGVAAAVPGLAVRAGARYVYPFTRTLLPAKDSYERVDLELERGRRADYLALEAEATATVPVWGGSAFAVLTGYRIGSVPDDQFLFEESLRAVMDPPYIFRGSLGVSALLRFRWRRSCGACR